MKWIADMLRRWEWLPHFTRDEEINADIENSLVDQKRAVSEAQKASSVLQQNSERVRKVLQDARLQTSTFAQFEQRIRDPFKSRRLEH